MTPVARDVLVAVPARDEAESIEVCLGAVAAAVRDALERGTAGRVRIAVAAHRCHDRTAERASAYLHASGLDHVVLADDESDTVGAVRSRLVEAAMVLGP
ncbi:MAG: hypothetical protein ACRYG2_00255, partial [Janthinobacterium lividum]